MTERSKKIQADRPLSRRRFLQLSTLAAASASLGFPSLLRARGVSQKLNVGFIGLGGMGCSRLREILDCDVNVVALCDVDDNQLAAAKNLLPSEVPIPKNYTDYRELLASDLDAVVVASPDHWHAPLDRAALLAGKHVFGEKPLTHTISEARELRLLSQKHSKLATQMGNQGSASAHLRRGIELIQAGAIGPVREVHVWVPPSGSFKPGQSFPQGKDPVPAGLHWDQWIGPAPFHVYKQHVYHPRAWRAWYDFGGGSIGDWGCHGLNLPVRALKLGYPTAITPDVPGAYTDSYPKNVRLRFEFAARQSQPPVTIWWYDGGRRPPENVLPKSVLEHFGETPRDGVLMLGENGFTFGAPHPGADYIQLKGEKRLSGILNHKATKNIPPTLPRSPGHLKEWVNACNGGPATFSDFEVGGQLTEIVLTGVVALRLQQAIKWNGDAMQAVNAPGAARFIHAHYRGGWSI